MAGKFPSWHQRTIVPTSTPKRSAASLRVSVSSSCVNGDMRLSPPSSILYAEDVPLGGAQPFFLHPPQGPVHRSRAYLLEAELFVYALHQLVAVGALLFEQDERHRGQPLPGPRLDLLSCCQASLAFASLVAHTRVSFYTPAPQKTLLGAIKYVEYPVQFIPGCQPAE